MATKDKPEALMQGEYVTISQSNKDPEIEGADEWIVTVENDAGDSEIGEIKWNEQADAFVFYTKGCWLVEGSLQEIADFLDSINY